MMPDQVKDMAAFIRALNEVEATGCVRFRDKPALLETERFAKYQLLSVLSFGFAFFEAQ
jgi:hypothetical protein